jgi:hypothetical protein
MSIINPNTGRPLQTGSRTLTDDQIIKAVAALDHRVNNLGEQLVRMGLYLEYLIEKINLATDAEGNPLIVLDLDEEFQEFAQTRTAQIQEEIEQIRQALAARQGVNLDDKTSE